MNPGGMKSISSDIGADHWHKTQMEGGLSPTQAGRHSEKCKFGTNHWFLIYLITNGILRAK
jgi:hypothetical protein